MRLNKIATIEFPVFSNSLYLFKKWWIATLTVVNGNTWKTFKIQLFFSKKGDTASCEYMLNYADSPDPGWIMVNHAFRSLVWNKTKETRYFPIFILCCPWINRKWRLHGFTTYLLLVIRKIVMNIRKRAIKRVTSSVHNNMWCISQRSVWMVMGSHIDSSHFYLRKHTCFHVCNETHRILHHLVNSMQKSQAGRGPGLSWGPCSVSLLHTPAQASIKSVLTTNIYKTFMLFSY